MTIIANCPKCGNLWEIGDPASWKCTCGATVKDIPPIDFSKAKDTNMHNYTYKPKKETDDDRA